MIHHQEPHLLIPLKQAVRGFSECGEKSTELLAALDLPGAFCEVPIQLGRNGFMFCHQRVVLVVVLFLRLRYGGVFADNRPDQLGILLQLLICDLDALING